MRLRAVSLLVFLVVLLVACRPSPTPTPIATQAATPTTVSTEAGTQTNEPVIVVERSVGAAKSGDRWAIYADGRVLAGQDKQSKVPPSAVAALLAQVESDGFFKIQAASPPACGSCSIYTITVTASGQTHSVAFSDAQQNAPQAFWTILDALNAFLSAPGTD